MIRNRPNTNDSQSTFHLVVRVVREYSDDLRLLAVQLNVFAHAVVIEVDQILLCVDSQTQYRSRLIYVMTVYCVSEPPV